jgi:hypothetical protein
MAQVDDPECKHIKGELIVESNEGGGVKFGDDGKTAFAEDRSAYSSMFYAIPRATVPPFLPQQEEIRYNKFHLVLFISLFF